MTLNYRHKQLLSLKFAAIACIAKSKGTPAPQLSRSGSTVRGVKLADQILAQKYGELEMDTSKLIT